MPRYACSDQDLWKWLYTTIGEGTSGHAWENTPDVVVNLFTLEAWMQARNEEYDILVNKMTLPVSKAVPKILDDLSRKKKVFKY